MGRKRNDNERTEHGENIAMQIQTTDAYGQFNTLTAADLWNIVDKLNTHFIDHNREGLARLTGECLVAINEMFPELETA